MRNKSWKHIYIPKVISVFVWINSAVAIFSVLYPFALAIFGSRMEQLHDFVAQSSDADHVSWIFQFLIAYVMLTVARGLYNRKRMAWLFYIIMLSLLVGNDLIIAHSLRALTVIDIGVLIILIFSYKIFDVKSQRYNLTYYQVIVLISVLCAFAYGVVGTYMLRAEFYNVKGWMDAFYFTIVTYATVGYGDTYPITATAKMFVTTMIIFGLGTFATGLTVVVLPLIEERMKEILKIVRKVGRMQNHVILCGYTPLTRVLVKKLSEKRTPFVIIDGVERSHPTAEKKGYPVLFGESTDTEILKAASIEKASSIIILNEKDSDNILTIITAKELMESLGIKVRIIAKIEFTDNVKKALHSGADEVISPAIMAANEIMNQI